LVEVKGLARRVDCQFLPHAIGDIPKVARPRAQVTNLDVGVWLPTTFHALEEVLHVLRLPVGVWLTLGARFLIDPPAFIVDDQRAFLPASPAPGLKGLDFSMLSPLRRRDARV
jgi:hypothetical protein